jgi:hypothetical protein
VSATTPEEALKDILRNNAGVAAITTKCYPVKIPQVPVFPLMTYTLITDVPDNHLRGPSGLVSARYQVEAWAETYSANYSGTVGTVKVGSILRITGRDWYEEAVDCYRVIQDFSVWYAI